MSGAKRCGGSCDKELVEVGQDKDPLLRDESNCRRDEFGEDSGGDVYPEGESPEPIVRPPVVKTQERAFRRIDWNAPVPVLEVE